MEGCIRRSSRRGPRTPPVLGGWGLSTFLTPTYTLRRRLGARGPHKRSRVRTRVSGDPLCMGGSERGSHLPYKVGHPDSPPSRAGSNLRRFPTRRSRHLYWDPPRGLPPSPFPPGPLPGPLTRPCAGALNQAVCREDPSPGGGGLPPGLVCHTSSEFEFELKVQVRTHESSRAQ